MVATLYGVRAFVCVCVYVACWVFSACVCVCLCVEQEDAECGTFGSKKNVRTGRRGSMILDGLSTCLFQAWRMQGGLELF